MFNSLPADNLVNILDPNTDLDAAKPVFGVSTKHDSNQSPHLQRLARKLKFHLCQV